jgi:hypothetical protein
MSVPNPIDIVKGAINTVSDLASGNISKAGQDFLGTAVQAAPLLLPGAGSIASLATSALGGGLASSIFGAASGLPNIASGLSSVLPGLGGILGGIFGPGGGTGGSGGTSGSGQSTLDGSSLSQLKGQLADQLNFQKQSDALIEAFKRASTIESIRHQLTTGVLDKITA